MAVKVDIDSEPLAVVEPDIVNESDSEVVEDAEPVPEVKVSYEDSCRFSSRAYHGASVIFDSYDGLIILEII